MGANTMRLDTSIPEIGKVKGDSKFLKLEFIFVMLKFIKYYMLDFYYHFSIVLTFKKSYECLRDLIKSINNCFGVGELSGL